MNVGDTVPEFDLISDSGETVRLAVFAGVRGLLCFHPRAGENGPTPRRGQRPSCGACPLRHGG